MSDWYQQALDRKRQSELRWLVFFGMARVFLFLLAVAALIRVIFWGFC